MEGPYTNLITAMDRYDNAEGLLSPRETTYAALAPQNTLGGYMGSGGKVFSKIAAARGPTQVGLFNYYRGSEFHYHAASQSTQKREKKEGERQEPGALAIIAVAALAGLAALAAGYSVSRMQEISSAQKEIDAILPDAEKAEADALYFNEPKECKERLLRELKVAKEGLSKDLRYYRVTTFSSMMLLLGVGALAYHKLYRRSSAAQTLMIASLLTSAVSFGGALGFCGMGGAERKKVLETLNDSFAERRVLTHQHTQKTRYDTIVELNNPPPLQPREKPSAPPLPENHSDYPDLYTGIPVYDAQDFPQ